MGFFNTKKKKVTYKLVKNGKAVDIGSTNNPGRRNAEHSRSGKDYDYMQVTSRPITKSEAERREARNIASYREAVGRNPKYNKTADGKYKRRRFY